MNPVGRPRNPDNKYKMGIHKTGKYLYASTQVVIDDKNPDEHVKRKFKHIHWGKLDENLVFIPNSSFLYLTPSERAKYIFPDTWDVSKVNEYFGDSKAPSDKGIITVDQGVIAVANSRSYGAVWLFERISDRLGVREDLMAVFEYDQQKVNDIMTVAMYLFITNYNLDRLEDWQKIEKYPSERILNPVAITRLQKSITEQNRIDFCHLRALRNGNGKVLACDSTSKTGFGVKLIDLALGKNKEGLNLPVTLEVVIYSITDHVPVYYKTFAGNTYDSRTMDIVLADIRESGFEDFVLLMDRAYPSVKNLDRFIINDVHIVACMKASVSYALAAIKEFGNFDFVPDGFAYDEDLDLYTAQYDLQRTVNLDNGKTVESNKMKLNLYFDPIKRSSVLKKLDTSMAKERAELDKIIECETSYTVDEMEIVDDKYDLFNLSWISIKIPIEECPDYIEPEHKRGRKKQYIKKYQLKSYERDTDAMKNARRSAGFRALISLGEDFTAHEAMEHYGLRAEQEMDNEQWKTLMQCDRERNSSEATKTGASFIQFTGRIMSCYLRYAWRSSVDLRKIFRSSLAIVDEMRRIRCIEYPKQSSMHLTPFIGRQLVICKTLGFSIPEGCKPDRDAKI